MLHRGIDKSAWHRSYTEIYVSSPSDKYQIFCRIQTLGYMLKWNSPKLFMYKLLIPKYCLLRKCCII